MSDNYVDQKRESWLEKDRDTDKWPDNESLYSDLDQFLTEYLEIKAGRVSNLKHLTRFLMIHEEDWMMLHEGMEMAKGKREALLIGYFIGELCANRRSTKIKMDFKDILKQEID